MGSVRKDPRHSGWQARYRTRSGKQRTKTFPTKGEASNFLRATEIDIEQGYIGDRSSPRFDSRYTRHVGAKA